MLLSSNGDVQRVRSANAEVVLVDELSSGAEMHADDRDEDKGILDHVIERFKSSPASIQVDVAGAQLDRESRREFRNYSIADREIIGALVCEEPLGSECSSFPHKGRNND